MEKVQYILHLGNGALFGIALYLHLLAFKQLFTETVSGRAKRLCYSTLLCGVFLTGIFLFLQADWVLNEQNANVGDTVSWAWLTFDYLLASYLCFNASTLIASIVDINNGA